MELAERREMTGFYIFLSLLFSKVYQKRENIFSSRPTLVGGKFPCPRNLFVTVFAVKVVVGKVFSHDRK